MALREGEREYLPPGHVEGVVVVGVVRDHVFGTTHITVNIISVLSEDVSHDRKGLRSYDAFSGSTTNGARMHATLRLSAGYFRAISITPSC